MLNFRSAVGFAWWCSSDKRETTFLKLQNSGCLNHMSWSMHDLGESGNWKRYGSYCCCRIHQSQQGACKGERTFTHCCCKSPKQKPGGAIVSWARDLKTPECNVSYAQRKTCGITCYFRSFCICTQGPTSFGWASGFLQLRNGKSS